MEALSFQETVKHLNDLRQFLRSAPSQFGPGDRIRRHELPNSEVVSCVKWDEDFFISGTDILRCIVYRFQAFGREVVKRAKFEEFVFSDLRSLKTNVRARLEEGKSELLVFLHDYGCIRTKKKQRVFFWDAVPHDQLFLDTLERELRRAVIDSANNHEHRISVAVREPALSMRYDPLQKVAHQINNILSKTPFDQKEIMSAVFGVHIQMHHNQGHRMQLPYQIQQMLPSHNVNQNYSVHYAIPGHVPQPIQPLHPMQHVPQALQVSQQVPMPQQIGQQMPIQQMQTDRMQTQSMSVAPPIPHLTSHSMPHLMDQSLILKGDGLHHRMSAPSFTSTTLPHPTSGSVLDHGNEKNDSISPSMHHHHHHHPHFSRHNPNSNHLLPSLKHTQQSPKHAAPIGALHKILNADQRSSHGSSCGTNDTTNLLLPEMNPPSSTRDTDLPSIRDALPMHAQIDLHFLPGPQQQQQQCLPGAEEEEEEENEDAVDGEKEQ